MVFIKIIFSIFLDFPCIVLFPDIKLFFVTFLWFLRYILCIYDVETQSSLNKQSF